MPEDAPVVPVEEVVYEDGEEVERFTPGVDETPSEPEVVEEPEPEIEEYSEPEVEEVSDTEMEEPLEDYSEAESEDTETEDWTEE
jgi:hypothetical protein